MTMVVFALIQLLGDPTVVMLPPDASEANRLAFRSAYGLDQPFYIQYWRYLLRAARGDFGNSISYHEPALSVFLSRLPATFQLSLAAIELAIIIAIPAGIISAVKRNSYYSYVTMTFVLLGQSIATFWLGMMLILVFAVKLGWLPAAGRDGPASLVLPAVALGAFSMARIARMARSGMLEVLAQDYVRTARAAGVRAFVVTYKYALKNAAIPLVTIVGLEFGVLLGGAVITETIFAWPGVGRLAVDAIFSRDYPLVQAIVAMLATLFVLINLVMDLVYTYLDPRIVFVRSTQ